MTNSAAIIFKLADYIPAEQLATDLSAGQLNGAIEALSNLELSETAVALGPDKEGTRGRRQLRVSSGG